MPSLSHVMVKSLILDAPPFVLAKNYANDFDNRICKELLRVIKKILETKILLPNC